MDTVFQEAVTKIIEMPQGIQRVIGEALLEGAGHPDLPVIEFTDEENAMIDEGLADIEAGRVHSQAEIELLHEELRANLASCEEYVHSPET